MDNSLVLKMDLASKILFSLFNFFAPISVSVVVLSQFEHVGFLGTLISLFCIAIGLILLIRGIKKYNLYLTFAENKLFLCKGKANNLKTLKSFSISELSENELNLLKTKLAVIENGKEKFLLNYKPSLLGLICYAGPFIIIPILKQNLIYEELFYKLSQVFPDENKKKAKTGIISVAIINIVAWLFVLFISFVGTIGVFLTPFYMFL